MPLAKAKVCLPIWSVPFSTLDRQSVLSCSASLVFTVLTFIHRLLLACSAAQMLCLYTQFKLENPTLGACLLAPGQNKDTHSHVFLYSPADSCAAQSCKQQYMLGKVILVNIRQAKSSESSKTHVCCSTLLLLSVELSTRWSSSLMGLVATGLPTAPSYAALCVRYIKALELPLWCPLGFCL